MISIFSFPEQAIIHLEEFYNHIVNKNKEILFISNHLKEICNTIDSLTNNLHKSIKSLDDYMANYKSQRDTLKSALKAMRDSEDEFCDLMVRMKKRYKNEVINVLDAFSEEYFNKGSKTLEKGLTFKSNIIQQQDKVKDAKNMYRKVSKQFYSLSKEEQNSNADIKNIIISSQSKYRKLLDSYNESVENDYKTYLKI